MDEENIITVPYSEVDERLKDDIRDHFRNDDYFLNDDWYEFALEHIEQKYDGQVEIDKKSISFDMYRNDFNWEGYFSFKHKDNKKFIPVKYYEYVEAEWIYDVNGDFKNDEIRQDYSIDTNLIYQDALNILFGRDIKLEYNEHDIAEVTIDVFKPGLINALQKDNLAPMVKEQLNRWLQMVEASEIFFQPTVEIDKSDVVDIGDDFGSDLEKEVTDFMEDTFYPAIDEFLSHLYDEWVDALKKEYDYNYSDEYADEILSDREFQVVVDEQGKQIEVVDLGGD